MGSIRIDGDKLLAELEAQVAELIPDLDDEAQAGLTAGLLLALSRAMTNVLKGGRGLSGTLPAPEVEGATGGGGGAVASVFGRTGTVTAQSGDYSAFYRPISWVPAWSDITGSVSGSTSLTTYLGANYQPLDDMLTSLAGLSPDGAYLIVGDGAAWTTIAQSTFLHADGSISWLADMDGGGFRLVNLADGVDPGDAVTKAQAEAMVQAIADGMDWQGSVLAAQAAPPVGPTTGDRYLVTATASGAWTGEEEKIARWDGAAWDFVTPSKGTAVHVEATGRDMIYVGGDHPSGSWQDFGVSVSHAALLDRGWLTCGHTGTANRIAGFDGSGATAVFQVGVDLQAWDADLDALAALSTTGLVKRTGAATYATAAISAFAESILDDADGPAVRTTIGAAKSGSNSDITELTGLTTALSIAQGGTGATSASAALAALGGVSKAEVSGIAYAISRGAFWA